MITAKEMPFGANFTVGLNSFLSAFCTCALFVCHRLSASYGYNIQGKDYSSLKLNGAGAVAKSPIEVLQLSGKAATVLFEAIF